MTPYRETRPRALPKRAGFFRVLWATLTRGLRKKLRRRAERERWWRFNDDQRATYLFTAPAQDAIDAFNFRASPHDRNRIVRTEVAEVAHKPFIRADVTRARVAAIRVPDDETAIKRM